MKRTLLLSCLTLAALSPFAAAQPGHVVARSGPPQFVEVGSLPPPPSICATPGLPGGIPCGVPCGIPCECPEKKPCGPPGRIWARGEYLLWWVEGSNLPPLLTTSPPGTPAGVAGILGEPGTSVLVGNESTNDDLRSGGRFTLGYWLNEEQTLGVEGNFFFLGQTKDRYFLESDGNVILGRPFFDPTIGAQNVLGIGFPGVVAGNFDATTTNTLWGGDVYLRKNCYCTCDCRIDCLAGYRFLRMDDDLRIGEREINLDPLSGIPVGFAFDVFDQFRTRNDFHGGQVGLAGEYRCGRIILQATGKVALGVNCRRVDIAGFTRETNSPPLTGGVLAGGTNIGRYRDEEFSVVPEGIFSVGYQLTDHLRVFAGYTFLYWTNVLRPGDQIDLTVNPTQFPPGQLVGEARPAFSPRSTDVWAQGIHFGAEVRY